MADISQVKLPNGDTYNLVDETSGYIKNYTETDPVFSASAAAGITATDISNWNAKVSDDKTWNGVVLNKAYMNNKSSTIVPIFESGAAYYYIATATPSGGKVVLYDNNAYLNSTTPSANDNSTKVATTAYVDAAIPDVSGYVNKSGDTMSGDLTMSANKLIFSISDSANIVIKHGQGGMVAPILDISAAENGTVYIRGVKNPSSTTDAANKAYVDSAVPKVYSSTNTGGYLTMATLPIYDGTVV